jgi:hypothetical protein
MATLRKEPHAVNRFNFLCYPLNNLRVSAFTEIRNTFNDILHELRFWAEIFKPAVDTQSSLS